MFVCPYHAWSYGLDGRLRAARHMAEGFDRAAHGLKSLHTRVVEGLIFVSFAESPLGLEHVEAALAGSARLYGWAEAKVAHRETYPVQANWKLAVENYMHSRSGADPCRRVSQGTGAAAIIRMLPQD